MNELKEFLEKTAIDCNEALTLDEFVLKALYHGYEKNTLTENVSKSLEELVSIGCICRNKKRKGICATIGRKCVKMV